MLGWRKLTAWGLVFAGTYALLFLGKDMTPITADVIKWVTGFFFGANAIKAFAGVVSVNVDKPGK